MTNISSKDDIFFPLNLEKISFVHNVFVMCLIIRKFRTNRDSMDVVIYQNYWTNEIDFVDEQNFATRVF